MIIYYDQVRFPGRENGNPLQYSCWGNPMDRGVWQAIVCGVKKNYYSNAKIVQHLQINQHVTTN